VERGRTPAQREALLTGSPRDKVGPTLARWFGIAAAVPATAGPYKLPHVVRPGAILANRGSCVRSRARAVYLFIITL
jgi:hypothetical protein